MRIATLAVAAALTGCVTQGTFDALQREHEATQDELAKKNEALRALDVKHQAALKKGESLEKSLADAQDALKDLNARLARLTAEMAAASKDKTRLQASVDEMTVAIAELEKRRAQAEARVNEFKNLLSRFKTLIDAGRLKVRIVDGRMVVVLATDILFASGSASLSKDGKAAVGEVAQVLASIPQRAFQVEGHTDNVPIATAQYPSNWELAAARAINVLKAMVENGLPASRVSAASFGDSKPVVVNDTPELRALNRRIEIIIVPDLSSLPGFEELQKIEKGG
ncbi:MAG: OmpA family protein [Myxococcaceae bacterium]|nr:OmpA family protein [Myxococcaceae bacterium]